MAFDSKEKEFADISVSTLGAQLSGLRGLTYKKSQEKEIIYAAGNKPKAIQSGNIKYEGTLTILKSDFDLLNLAARAAGYEDIIAVPPSLIHITCVYQPQEGGVLQTDTLVSCAFTEFEEGMKQGDKFKEIALSFIFLRLKQA